MELLTWTKVKSTHEHTHGKGNGKEILKTANAKNQMNQRSGWRKLC